MKFKSKKFSLIPKKSLLVLLVFTLIVMLSVPAIAQDTDQDKIELIKNYISENEVESLSHPLILILERRIDENNEISTNYIYALIDSYAEGEMELGEVYAAVNNLNKIQNSGVPIDEIEEFTSNTEDIDNHGMMVSAYAHQLAAFAKEVSQEDEENAGMQISAMAQELSRLAADKGEISEEDMISIRERRRNEMMNNSRNNRANGKGMSKDHKQSNNSAANNGSGNMSDKASENKPEDKPGN